MAICCLFASIILILYLFSFFKQVTGLESATLWDLLDWQFILSAFGVFFFVATLSGLYPAFYLSKLAPVQALKNRHAIPGNTWLQKTLLVFQFSASIVLIICALFLKEQMDFLFHKELGFTKQGVVLVELPEGVTYHKEIVKLKEELLNHTFVEKASLVGGGSVPGIENGKDIVTFLDKKGTAVEKVLNVFSWDEDFLDILTIELVKGRNFSEKFSTDKKKCCLSE